MGGVATQRHNEVRNAALVISITTTTTLYGFTRITDNTWLISAPNVLAAGHGKTVIQCSDDTAVSPCDNPHSPHCIFGGDACDDGGGAIGGAIVDYDEFKVAE